MVFTRLIEAKRRAYATFLSREKDISVQEIMFKCNISRASVYRLKKEDYSGQVKRARNNVGGRPRKLTKRDERKLLRAMMTLRKEEGQFSSCRLMERAGIGKDAVSNRTIRRVLRRNGFFYLQARKKGLMSEKDLALRLEFAKRIKKTYPCDVWQKNIAFYLDGVSFYYKTNPADQARAPRGRIWRRKCEGLKRGCTAKGSKEGSGGKVVKVLVAVSYEKGVIECSQYEKLNGEFFASFVEKNFDGMFERAGKGISRLWIQDGDPSQNCAAVRKMLTLKDAELLPIPPRSPDINPIENFFHLVKLQLQRQAIELNITKETYEEFSARVIRTILDFPAQTINKIIDTMDQRMTLIIEGKGNRTKF